MKIQELATNSTDFNAQALLKITKEQQLIIVEFTELSESDGNKLSDLIAQLDSFGQLDAGKFTAMINLRAFQQLIKIWNKFFNTDKSQLEQIFDAHKMIWKTGDYRYDLTNTAMIYGIMNNTPDSFYDGGYYQGSDVLLKHVEDMLENGADVIEVNGQTTRPGFTEVSPETEIERTIPLIQDIKKYFPDTNIAIDTYKLPVMEAALAEGVSIINDVNAFVDNPDKLKLMAGTNAGLLTMHSSRGHEYKNLTKGMHEFFEENIGELVSAGIDADRIAIDQGIGYSKVVHGAQDYSMIRNLDQFNDLQRPMMVAISRKGFFGDLLGIAKDDRLPMTLVTEAAMYLEGGRILRVHDVEETQQLVTLLDQIQDSFWIEGLGNSNNL
ncbi:dihydropteroate synthase [Companilactobacillus ginsenosidimutans]|uniref:Dihydropteroate synthase n=1 Tax=Companilactobacillus ginsenosidimutans TaxID=1007676 RepID=A0A0H4R1D2_9LACO|nr:dihydropteroate synthase [Companilactobacillus ginsenosidimutans]AKP67525.1 dihydropteroate synthase [Companilactobacillus ginsenosidimutans]